MFPRMMNNVFKNAQRTCEQAAKEFFAGMEDVNWGKSKDGKESSLYRDFIAHIEQNQEFCREMFNSVHGTREDIQSDDLELRQSYQDWLAEVKDNVLSIIDDEGEVSPKVIAEKLEMSGETIEYFIKELLQKGQIEITGLAIKKPE